MKRTALYGFIASLSVLVSACGGGAAPAPAASSAAPPAATASAAAKPAGSAAAPVSPATSAAASAKPAPSAAAAPASGSAAAKPAGVPTSGPNIDVVKQKKELVVGVEAAFEPFETLDNGKFVGFDIDLSNLVADGLGAKAKFIDTEYPGLIPGLQQKKFDTVISAIVVTEQRSQQVNFSQPYAESTQKLMVRNDDNSIKSRDDLRGKTVAVQAGTTSEQLVRQLDEDFKKSGEGIKKIAVFDHTPEMFLDLDSKRSDAAITLLPSAAQMMKKSPNKFKAASDFGPKSYVGIVSRKDTPDLSDYFDAKLGEIKQSGKLGELETTWFGAKSSGIPEKKLY